MPLSVRSIRGRVRSALWLIPALLVLAVLPPHGLAVASSTATVTVSSTPAGTIQTQLSTNNVWSGGIDQVPAAQQRFNALHDPLVRLHVGDDGSPAAMPEITYGQWSFAALDTLVNDVTQTGQQPLMNIKFAPDWMWTCTTFGAAGAVRDQTFHTFATYMARLVNYYNRGSMTTEAGQVITNPAGTSNRITYWELWNEPDLDNETPCAPATGQSLTPDQYLTMWNAVTGAMLAVDPTLKFVGPATAGGQFGSSTASGNAYIDALMTGASVKPAAISFHGYGYWDNTVPDSTIFDGDSSGAGGIGSILAAVQSIRSTYPTLPVWLTEVNVNADWGSDPAQRPWNAFSAAWWGAAFAQLAPLGVQLINQYDVVDGPQFGLIDDQTGAPRLPYWEQRALNAAYPPGSTLLGSGSTSAGVLSLAAQRPDGVYSVLVVDRQVDAPTTVGGNGLPATVTVNLQGFQPSAISLTQIGRTTSSDSGPATVSLGATSAPQITFDGYGMAVLTVTAGSGGTPTATSTPDPTATSTPHPTATPPATSTSVPTATAPTSVTVAGSTSASGNFGAGLGMTVPVDRAGDLLITAAGTNGTPTGWTAPAGWTAGGGSGHPGGQGLNWWWRVATGKEGGTRVTLRSQGWADGGAVLLVLRGLGSHPIAGVGPLAANANGGNGNVTSAAFRGVSWSGSASVVSLLLLSWQPRGAALTWPAGFAQQAVATDGYGYVAVAARLTRSTGTTLPPASAQLAPGQAVAPGLQLALRAAP